MSDSAILRGPLAFSRSTGGNVAVMTALLLPVLIGGLGLRVGVGNWYLNGRAMQNAADSAALAAASNASSNYAAEGKAVAAQYGFVDGASSVSVLVSNTATCPSGTQAGVQCYSVSITSQVPLYLAGAIGFQGNTVVNGVKRIQLASSAIAAQSII